ncbi:MAG: alcohol dehydrogenase catalytic domain-containing protein, partial [Propionibacteriaceae bacterium]
MMALRAHTRGGPEVLVVEPAPVPVPGPDEVLLEVYAAAITFAELTWEETWQRNGADRTPVIPAHEVSGVVVATGGPDLGFAVGDKVFGLIRFDRDGAAAEYVALPAADLAASPTSTTHSETAALPLAALTRPPEPTGSDSRSTQDTSRGVQQDRDERTAAGARSREDSHDRTAPRRLHPRPVAARHVLAT